MSDAASAVTNNHQTLFSSVYLPTQAAERRHNKASCWVIIAVLPTPLDCRVRANKFECFFPFKKSRFCSNCKCVNLFLRNASEGHQLCILAEPNRETWQSVVWRCENGNLWSPRIKSAIKQRRNHKSRADNEHRRPTRRWRQRQKP